MGSTTRIRAAISNNPTRRNLDASLRWNRYRTFTFCGAPFEVTSHFQLSTVTKNLKTTIRHPLEDADFKFELCSLHSPLLRASQANRTQAPPTATRDASLMPDPTRSGTPCGITRRFRRLAPTAGQIAHVFLFHVLGCHHLWPAIPCRSVS
jgi:hypothetical protein